VVLLVSCKQTPPPGSSGPVESGRTATTSLASADPSARLPPPPSSASPCPDDMVEVKGAFCTELEQRCLKNRKPWQCAEFERPSRCRGERKPMHYCIDRYEYPNRKGDTPLVMQSFDDGKAKCEAQDKRLCTDSEWTLACEGPDELPFPYGHVRDSERCPIDKRSPKVDEARLFNRRTQDAEVARLDQREPSGSRPRCRSAYGVFDQTGNVDEWVVNETGRPHQSALKGGNWGEYRNACRPATRAHDEGFRYYQTGFRCCRDL
jgi:formylglycine-generating enzyme required for sulfatase activity